MPSRWRDASALDLPVRPDWWRQFRDPALDALVDRALEANPDLMVAAARIEQARAQLHLAASRSKLSLGLGGQGGEERSINAFGLGVDQAEGQGLATASYEVDLFNRLGASTQAARYRLLASQEARDTVRIALAASVVDGYIRLRALDAQLAIAQETLATRADGLRLITRRVAAGYSPALEGDQAQSEYETAAQLVPALQLSITQQENTLRILLGDSPGTIERGAALADWTVPPAPSSLPSEVLRQRPDIAQAESVLAGTEQDLKAARAAFMPRITLGATGGLANSTLIANPISLFSLGGSILAPILEGGALGAQRDDAAARRNEAAFAYKKAALSAFAQVENAMASVQRLEAEEAAAARDRDALARAFKLADERYRAGYAPFLDRLDAERSLLGARLSVVSLQAQRLEAIVLLNQSLGGGWSPART
jgi:NodT family efflux transporter outer membrane factor (OMF) lipoprotein